MQSGQNTLPPLPSSIASLSFPSPSPFFNVADHGMASLFDEQDVCGPVMQAHLFPSASMPPLPYHHRGSSAMAGPGPSSQQAPCMPPAFGGHMHSSMAMHSHHASAPLPPLPVDFGMPAPMPWPMQSGKGSLKRVSSEALPYQPGSYHDPYAPPAKMRSFSGTMDMGMLGMGRVELM